MEKRLFLAIFLSIAFLFAWGAIAPRIFPDLARKPVPETVTPGPETATGDPALTPSPPATSIAEEVPATRAIDEPPVPAVEPVAAEFPATAEITSPLYRAIFSNRGAQLTSFQLLRYSERRDGEPVDLVPPRPPARADYPFVIVTADRRVNQLVNGSLYEVERFETRSGTEVRFRWAGEGISVTKTFRFVPDQYLFEYEIEMATPRDIPWRVAIGPGLRRLLPEELGNRFAPTGLGIVHIADDLEVLQREKVDGFLFFEGKPAYVGLQDNYFLAVFKPERGSGASFLPVQVEPGGGVEEARTELYAGINAVGGAVTGDAYFGPKETERLDRHGLEETLQFGVFGFIARVLLAGLVWINGWTHNYGWAIIVLTIFIKILLYPLQHKSMVSMKKMQQVQPKMNAIKDRYKKAKTDPDQRQKMNLEMMKLYKQEGINPASGCVPLLLQLPILWAFYTLLSRAVQLRGAEWILWINDLSVKDPYYITPLLMTITMFVQQWLTPTTADPMQRKIFLMMPIIFGWLFKEFPSGLVLYWLVQNILSIVQQLITNRYWTSHPAPSAKGA